MRALRSHKHRWHVVRGGRNKSRRVRGSYADVICLVRGCPATWSPPAPRLPPYYQAPDQKES